MRVPEATSTHSCRPGRVEGGRGALSPSVACLPPVGTSASAQPVPNWRPPIPAPPTPPGSNSLVTPLRGTLDQSKPWHAGGGGAGPSSPEMCAGVIKPLDRKRVSSGCAWGRWADSWLESGSQLCWSPHSRLSRRWSEEQPVREAGMTEWWALRCPCYYDVTLFSHRDTRFLNDQQNFIIFFLEENVKSTREEISLVDPRHSSCRSKTNRYPALATGVT
jgi:hypothetical protein